MKNFNKMLQWIVLIAAVALVIFYFKNNHRVYDRAKVAEIQTVASEDTKTMNPPTGQNNLSTGELTAEDVIINYVRKHGKLPDCYITKNEARNHGWIASAGNLCDVLPGRAIGGDRFGNRDRQLPDKEGRQYFEADLNCICGKRGADRLVFSNDGLIFVTHDHYKTFEKK
jgi:guanyl-specific ribonuclease Sa